MSPRLRATVIFLVVLLVGAFVGLFGIYSIASPSNYGFSAIVPILQILFVASLVGLLLLISDEERRRMVIDEFFSKEGLDRLRSSWQSDVERQNQPRRSTAVSTEVKAEEETAVSGFWFTWPYIFSLLIEWGLNSSLRYLITLPLTLPIMLLVLLLFSGGISQLPGFRRPLTDPAFMTMLMYSLGLIFRTWFFLAFWLGMSNVILSLVAWVGLPTGGFLTRWALGARALSRRERTILFEALENLATRFPEGSKKTLAHDSWWVIDAIMPNTYTIGTALYVTTAALADEHFIALLAHEVGHRNQGDGHKLKALRNLVYPVFQHAFTSSSSLKTGTPDEKSLLAQMGETVFSFFFALWFGGFGVLIFAPALARWFRSQDYKADRFAYECGVGPELVDHLEEMQRFQLAVPFYNTWVPYGELRMDRIRLLLGE